MLFLDLSEWCETNGQTLDEVMKAGWDVGVAWQDGRPFHQEYGIRMNLALPLSRVQEAFRREWLMMKKDEVTFDYSYAFGALGFVGLLRTWLERDCVEKADDMAVLSDRMIRLGLTSSLQTP